MAWCRPRTRNGVLLALACLVVLGPASSPPARACSGYGAYQGLPAADRHELDWQVFASAENPGQLVDQRRLVSDGTKCRRSPVEVLRSAIVAGLARGGLAIVGEVHDNPHHHHVRAYFLRGLSDTKPAAVFEHIRADQQQGLALFADLARNGQHLGTVGEFFRFLKWAESGWPDKQLFEPLFKATIDRRLPIVPGDPAREKVRAVARQGNAALGADEIARLKLDQPLEASLADALATELEASHCGLVPKSAFTTMAAAQRYRDAHLAEALVKAGETHGSAVLFAGNGHVRGDRGAPYYTRQFAPGKALTTVLLVEVEAGKKDPAAYVPRDPSGKPVADYVLFTPRAVRKDPCIEMRERFGRRP